MTPLLPEVLLVVVPFSSELVSEVPSGLDEKEWDSRVRRGKALRAPLRLQTGSGVQATFDVQ